MISFVFGSKSIVVRLYYRPIFLRTCKPIQYNNILGHLFLRKWTIQINWSSSVHFCVTLQFRNLLPLFICFGPLKTPKKPWTIPVLSKLSILELYFLNLLENIYTYQVHLSIFYNFYCNIALLHRGLLNSHVGDLLIRFLNEFISLKLICWVSFIVLFIIWLVYSL